MCFFCFIITKLIKQVIVEAVLTLLTALIEQVTQHTQKAPALVLIINEWWYGGTLDP